MLTAYLQPKLILKRIWIPFFLWKKVMKRENGTYLKKIAYLGQEFQQNTPKLMKSQKIFWNTIFLNFDEGKLLENFVNDI